MTGQMDFIAFGDAETATKVQTLTALELIKDC